MSIKEHLCNDLEVKTELGGGFTFVHLYDRDDGHHFLLGEQEIVELRNYLNDVIELHQLEKK